MNQDGRPIINQLNNGVINAPNAMPLKNLTSNNEQSFELDRKLFKKSYNPRTNFAIPQISKSIVQRNAPGMHHGFVIDGPKTTVQKKWIGGNRDASKVTMHQRRRATGTALLNTGPQSFNTTSDNNVTRHALARLRGSGYTVPPKVTGRIINFNLPIPPTPPVDYTKYYRIISAGKIAYDNGNVFSATGGLDPGFYNYSGINMTPLATTANGLFQRSYNVMTINRTTGLITNIQSFDVYGADPGKGSITTITSYLNGLTSEVIVVVATFDEPQSNTTPYNPLTDDFIIEMQNCGASSDFGSSTAETPGILYYRSSYILVGIPGIRDGKEIQRYVGRNNVDYPDGDPDAFIDLRISVLNGEYTVINPE